MTVKQIYRDLCKTQPSIPLFSQDWWLDAVCGDQWDVVIIEDGGAVQAAMPYYITKRKGFKFIAMPPLTQTLGPWLKPLSQKTSKAIAREKKMIRALFDGLPKYDALQQNFSFKMTNWLPLYWRGFSQSTRYTYQLDYALSDSEIWDGMEGRVRSDVRKATNKANLTLVMDGSIEDFITLNAMVFVRQNKSVPYTPEFLRRLDKTLGAREQRQLFVARDAQGRNHAAVYMVWDHDIAYYLLSGADPDLRASGAQSLLLWEAIKFCREKSKTFDFEGSMMEPIEKYFRAFGGGQTSYMSVTHRPNRLIKIIYALR